MSHRNVSRQNQTLNQRRLDEYFDDIGPSTSRHARARRNASILQNERGIKVYNIHDKHIDYMCIYIPNRLRVPLMSYFKCRCFNYFRW